MVLKQGQSKLIYSQTAITLTKKINIITYFENIIIELHVIYVLICMLNFMLIECYLLLDPKIYFLYIIINFKN